MYNTANPLFDMKRAHHEEYVFVYVTIILISHLKKIFSMVFMIYLTPSFNLVM